MRRPACFFLMSSRFSCGKGCIFRWWEGGCWVIFRFTAYLAEGPMSQETLYVVRDSAGSLYGPANVPTLRQWVAEGRITATMHVAQQGTQQFVMAGEMFDLADAFVPAQQAAAGGAIVHNPQNPYGQD